MKKRRLASCHLGLAWKPILEAARRGGVVLLYSARDAEHNNALALRDYLAAKVNKG